MNSSDKFSKIGYILSSRVVVTGLNFITLIVFARFLLPEDYGIFGLTISLVGVFRLIINFYTEYIIHDKGIGLKEMSTFFWINIIISLSLFLGTIFCKEPISFFSGMPELGSTCSVLAFLIIIESLGIQSRIMMIKSLNFKAYSTIEAASVLASFIISFAIILCGFSYWGLIFKFSLDTLIANCTFIFASKWLPRLDFKRSLMLGGLRYSIPLIANSFVMSFSLFAQNFIINKHLGKSNLGVFNQANKVYTIALQSVVYPIGRFAFPYLSKKKDDPDDFKREYLYLCKTLSIMVLPMAFFIIAFPKEIVLIILGKNWLEVVPVLKSFSFVLLANCFLNTHRWLFLSLGNTFRMFIMALLKTLLYILAVIIAVKKGLVAVGYALSLVEFVLLIPFILVAKAGTKISLIEIARSQLIGITSAAISLTLPLLAWHFFNGVSTVVFISIIMPLYLSVYIFLLSHFKVLEFLKGQSANSGS